MQSKARIFSSLWMLRSNMPDTFHKPAKPPLAPNHCQMFRSNTAKHRTALAGNKQAAGGELRVSSAGQRRRGWGERRAGAESGTAQGDGRIRSGAAALPRAEPEMRPARPALPRAALPAAGARRTCALAPLPSLPFILAPGRLA